MAPQSRKAEDVHGSRKGTVPMIASLLPGLRELRAPLTAGYIWLLGLWLSLRSLVPTDQPLGIYRDIVDLANWAGKPAILAASALVAYIIGTLSITGTGLIAIVLEKILDLIGRGKLAWLEPAHLGRINVNEILHDAVLNRLSSRFLDDPPFRDAVIDHISQLQTESMRWRTSSYLPAILESEHGDRLKQRAVENYLTRWTLLNYIVDTDPFIEVARQDLEYLAPRLIGREDAVYNEYDRLMAEGLFRISMFLPMVYLFGSLTLMTSPSWAIGFAAPIALLYVGSYSRGLARQNLAVALAAGRVESPALERLMNAKIEFMAYREVARDRY